MPLFSRADGDLVREEAPVRRIMPYLMPSRNESCVYHETHYRIADARVWLKAYNRAHTPRAILFQLVAYACTAALEARPRLNRFVSGGRIYQRRGVSVSFAVKTAFTDESPIAAVKLPAFPGESFHAFSTRISSQVDDARRSGRRLDREVALVMRLPGPAVRWLIGLARRLDRWNLYPGFMIRDDPMFSSLFLANLGSVGISDAFHHLYEYGTVSIFGAVSAPRRVALPSAHGVVSEDMLSVRWTFDERIDDAFSSARSLALVRNILEHPAEHLGPPEGTPTWRCAKEDARRS